MIPSDLRATIVSLLSRTKEGKVNWRKVKDLGISRYAGFAINFGTYTIILAGGPEEDEGPSRTGYFFRILNDQAEEAMYFAVYDTEEEDEDFTKMSELHELARRRAMKADTILSDLSEKLKSSDEIGHPEDNIPF